MRNKKQGIITQKNINKKQNKRAVQKSNCPAQR